MNGRFLVDRNMKISHAIACLAVLHFTSKCDAGTPVRLVDGPKRYAGRLEVFYQGEWGSVCGDYFSQEDANVVCGMLFNNTQGIINATIHYNRFYGRSNGPVMINHLNCDGSEEDIFFCKSNRWKNQNYCSYSYDVGLDCNTPVRLVDNGYGPYLVTLQHNGVWGDVCYSNFGQDEGEVLCRTMGLSSRNATYWFGDSYYYGIKYILNCDGTEEDVGECSIGDNYCGYSRSIYLQCGDTPIRLLNGRTELQGLLEVDHHGQWLQFCSDGFGPNEARVACRMISNGTNDITGTIELHYRSTYRYFYMVNQLKCSGNESDLSQCYSRPWGYDYCSTPYVITLDCNTVRLVDGTSNSYSQSGRVEVYSGNGTWGTVCDDSFGSSDARVICRMLGFHGYAEVYNGHFPSGHGSIAIDELQCRGYEDDIVNCQSNPWFVHDCSHSEDAGVACHEGYSTSSPDYVTATTQTEASVRLVNGSYYSGRVEVFYHGQWGTVCDSNFDHNDVQVICRSLGRYSGYNYGVAYYGAHFGEGQGNVIIEDLDCNGNEYHLGECRSTTWLSNGCDHSRDVGVDCNAYRYGSGTTHAYGTVSSGEYEGAVRLVNGDGRYSGRVEVFYDGRWGTVCDDSFDRRDAMVVCSILGINFGSSYIATYDSAYFGRGTGSIIIDELGCSGNEWGLSQCPSLPWYTHDCGHGEDVGINCYSPPTSYPWWYQTTENLTTQRPLPHIDDVIHVNCNENGWDIRIDMYRLREIYPGAKASDIYLGENTCTGTENWRYLNFQQGLRECLTSETVRFNALVYSNELVYAERDPRYQFIIRNYNWTVGVECDVQRNETSSGHLHHDNQNLMEPHVTGSSHFSVNMSFYTDPNFLHQISGNPLHVTVGEKVYAKVYTTTPDWSVKMRAHTCYAKPSQYSPDHMKFYLIQNGCEVDTNTHIISQSAHETRFVFQDFEYTSNHEGIYVFCDAVFCSSHDYSRQCQQTCNPIIRRNVHVEKMTVENSSTANTFEENTTVIKTNKEVNTVAKTEDETTKIAKTDDDITTVANSDETTIF